jgi:hypothetical protein
MNCPCSQPFPSHTKKTDKSILIFYNGAEYSAETVKWGRRIISRSTYF